MKRENLFLSTIDPNAHLLARQYGLGLEIAEFCTAWNMDEQFDQVWPGVEEKLKYSSRILLHAPFNELFPCAIDRKARELARCRYHQAIAVAQRCGAEKLVVHGGYVPMVYYPVWYTEQSILFWRDFAREIPEGITLCLENVLEEEPEMLLEILRQVDHPGLKMCLDVGHGNTYSKISPESWLETCAPWISHFHIHNNDGSWDTHSALPEGSIPMKELLNRAALLCPDATFTLELPEAETSVQWLLDNQLI